ncbi:hypothetical protein VSQ48_10930 [Candidatus Ventrimonas sp. KK005]|nr:hypothetical protein [Lachnospiraceae bacterium]
MNDQTSSMTDKYLPAASVFETIQKFHFWFDGILKYVWKMERLGLKGDKINWKESRKG